MWLIRKFKTKIVFKLLKIAPGTQLLQNLHIESFCFKNNWNVLSGWIGNKELKLSSNFSKLHTARIFCVFELLTSLRTEDQNFYSNLLWKIKIGIESSKYFLSVLNFWNCKFILWFTKIAITYLFVCQNDRIYVLTFKAIYTTIHIKSISKLNQYGSLTKVSLMSPVPESVRFDDILWKLELQ